jgi:hypothetical protein
MSNIPTGCVSGFILAKRAAFPHDPGIAFLSLPGGSFSLLRLAIFLAMARN